MTILVTATATLVYLHSRFVERPAERPVDEHQIFALANKFVACTASIFATAVGFAALAVSDIRPIREMGIWVAVGLAFTWVVVFTLFPALQRILRTPTRAAQAPRGGVVRALRRVAAALHATAGAGRWCVGALALSAAGGVALFGLPGVVEPMQRAHRTRSSTSTASRRSTATSSGSRRSIPGLSVTQVWLKGEPRQRLRAGRADGPARSSSRRSRPIPRSASAVGPTTILRMIRYLSGQGDAWPDDARGARGRVAAELEGCSSLEPMLQRFVQPHELAQAQLTVISRDRRARGLPAASTTRSQRHWAATVAANPALGQLEIADRGPRAAAREDGAEPGADAGRELRAHRRDHLRRVPAGVPQRQPRG